MKSTDKRFLESLSLSRARVLLVAIRSKMGSCFLSLLKIMPLQNLKTMYVPFHTNLKSPSKHKFINYSHKLVNHLFSPSEIHIQEIKIIFKIKETNRGFKRVPYSGFYVWWSGDLTFPLWWSRDMDVVILGGGDGTAANIVFWPSEVKAIRAWNEYHKCFGLRPSAELCNLWISQRKWSALILWLLTKHDKSWTPLAGNTTGQY
jgi:hypothetical protein